MVPSDYSTNQEFPPFCSTFYNLANYIKWWNNILKGFVQRLSRVSRQSFNIPSLQECMSTRHRNYQNAATTHSKILWYEKLPLNILKHVKQSLTMPARAHVNNFLFLLPSHWSQILTQSTLSTTNVTALAFPYDGCNLPFLEKISLWNTQATNKNM